mmetsp:Transcript_7760/g.11501  ORF Transcript_7760/g.11501 Transcript_7760/m.11501 type:complete len:103 (-) Transcript_7760:1543-1851(-)
MDWLPAFRYLQKKASCQVSSSATHVLQSAQDEGHGASRPMLSESSIVSPCLTRKRHADSAAPIGAAGAGGQPLVAVKAQVLRSTVLLPLQLEARLGGSMRCH